MSFKKVEERYTILFLSIITLITCLRVGVTFAENVDPNNDNSQFTYSENAGWFNFESTGGGAEVTASAVTGDVWAENIGWIRLNPAFGGVTNDGSGNLSGFAWSGAAGWINFNSTNGGGVTIDSNGDFDGYAWGENIGWIHFKNTSPAYKVNTSWRVAQASSGGGSSDDDDTPTPTPTPIPTPMPITDFTADSTSGEVPLTVNFTNNSTGNISRQKWTFGDGQASSSSFQKSVTYSYQKVGKYTVTLDVTRSGAKASVTKTDYITALEVGVTKPTPTAAPTDTSAPLPTSTPTAAPATTSTPLVAPTATPAASPEPVSTPQALSQDFDVDFIANPGSGFAPLDVQFTNLTSGNPSGFEWKFGDGESGSENDPLHTYKRPGIYTVGLLAKRGAETGVETKPNLINVNEGVPLTPSFEVSPVTGFAPLTVNFRDRSIGSIDKWNWEFGDGSTSNLQNPEHVYNSAGSFNVKLAVSGGDENGAEEKGGLINVEEGEGLTAGFTGEPLSGNVPFQSHFFDSSSGDVTGWTWDFGDGETSNGQNPVHSYKDVGTFTVKLVVNSSNNQSSEMIRTDYIEAKDGVGPTVGFTIEIEGFSEVQSLSGLSGRVSGQAAGDDLVMLTVKFRDFSSSPTGEIIGREWNFGDGFKSSEKDPAHTYVGTRDDTFAVTLTVQDAQDIGVETKLGFISMQDGTAEAVATPTPVSIVTPTPTPTPTPAPTPTPTPTPGPTETPALTPTPTPSGSLAECEGGGVPVSINVSRDTLIDGFGRRDRFNIRVRKEGRFRSGCSTDVKIKCVGDCDGIILDDSVTTNRRGKARTSIRVKRSVNAGKVKVVFSAGEVGFELPIVILPFRLRASDSE